MSFVLFSMFASRVNDSLQEAAITGWKDGWMDGRMKGLKDGMDG